MIWGGIPRYRCIFLRDFDGLLKEDLFLGYENSIYISTAVIGARQHSPIIEGLMKQYDDLNELKANNLVFNAYFKAKGMSIDGITKNEMVDGESVLILDDSYMTIGAFGRRPYTVHLAFGSWHRNSKSIINSVKLFLLKYKLVKIITIYKRLNLKIKEKANHPFFRKNSRC